MDKMRGFSLYFEKIPIIVVNESDSYNAQAFTLFHELGHLLKKQTRIDLDFDSNKSEEAFCNEFASHFLLPEKHFSSEKDRLSKERFPQKEMSEISSILYPVAKNFKVSRETVARRLLEERIINKNVYEKFKRYLNKEYCEYKDKIKLSLGRPRRERQKEILQQFGKTYITTVIDAYYKEELTLSKTCKLLTTKKTEYISELAKIL